MGYGIELFGTDLSELTRDLPKTASYDDILQKLENHAERLRTLHHNSMGGEEFRDRFLPHALKSLGTSAPDQLLFGGIHGEKNGFDASVGFLSHQELTSINLIDFETLLQNGPPEWHSWLVSLRAAIRRCLAANIDLIAIYT